MTADDGGCSSSNQGKSNGLNGSEVECPLCNSKRIWKAGFRRLNDGSKAQVYQCGECGHKFTDLKLRGKLDWSVQNFEDKRLNYLNGHLNNGDEDLRRSDMGMVALMEKPLQSVNRLAGGTAKSEFFANFALWLLKNGMRENTVESYLKTLKSMKTDIYDPDKVKEYIAKAKVSSGTKINMAKAYDKFLKFIKGSWEKPKYRAEEKLPFIPTEEELDILIAGAGRIMSTLLQLLKETGMRIGEALALKWIDIDFERRVVKITPEKYSKPRILPISESLVGKLKMLPKVGERLFPRTLDTYESDFNQQKKRLAVKMNNPRLIEITFHTFRHWKATMEYHKTKDIIYVKELLGHKNIQSTMIYISIEKALFQASNDEFHCKTATNIENASKLIEAGFDYVTTFNGVMLFRKRK